MITGTKGSLTSRGMVSLVESALEQEGGVDVE
jgi:hypothetical protein